ncbi:4-oxalomesaconate tautomerase [Rhodococcus sp. IEGM 1305]|uniref:4-oxalomesaconate tautomerase n=1 Tax=Rhodococcus sp. IEGM 1305 TaxID=3047092 RepID=UPI0024B783F3|nr:4-oxalomesaconate tautomerase [Rhodococcus sp. IEGM 1305]MDI9951056.1 4-oxalomesaconate tautomerase [Rhodococcus sp. IEGM 1305]
MGGIACTWMRGGTSKGAFFLAADLPSDLRERDDLLLRVMGSPDPRQIEGIGGAHPLTSKVAVIGPSDDPRADVDYLFLQVAVDQALVSSAQNCGNILAGVGPFAVEHGLVPADSEHTSVRIRMVNSDGFATATFPTPGGQVDYAGTCEIAGVPGAAAPISIAFSGTAGSTCGTLLPTGRVVDTIDGVDVTCIDNGMPTVLIAAADLGVSGHESPDELEADTDLADRLAHIRSQAGKLMGLGDVSTTTVPKMTLVAAPLGDGTLDTRTFIPVRCHTAIGVLGALTVGTAVRIPGSVADRLSRHRDDGVVRIEHPTGYFDVDIDLTYTGDAGVDIRRAAVIRTARTLFDGTVYPRPAGPHTEDNS